ncbi:MAG: ribosome assembly RNA-binding protein YhbY [Mariprofundaceae bacterium]
MPLTTQQRKTLKAKAHHLKPVIRIGQHGLTEAVVLETDITLNTHELIKVHIQQEGRENRLNTATSLSEQSHAELVHQIGKISILYRKKKTEK